MNQTNQLAKTQQVSNQIYALENNFSALARERGQEVNFKREALFAIQAMQNNDFLHRVAMENPQSLQNAVLNIATVGLSANPALSEVYYVPRDGRVCADISYRGLCTLATRSGVIKIIRADVVYENDEFELNGFGKEPTHKFKPFNQNRGQAIGVYCVAKLVSGEYLVEIMSIEECHAIRDRTQQWKKNQSGVWKDHEGEMMKKTVIKRAAKLWPKSTDRSMDEAIRITNEIDGIDFEAEKVEREEKRKAEIEESQERRAIAREEKDQMIGVITKLSGELTKGFTVAQKGQFVTEVLGVSKFSELNHKSNAEISAIVEKLNSIIPIEAEPVEEKRVIRNYAPGAENELR
jgi:recombination protein RecT